MGEGELAAANYGTGCFFHQWSEWGETKGRGATVPWRGKARGHVGARGAGPGADAQAAARARDGTDARPRDWRRKKGPGWPRLS
jgi:hypothetical protein